MRLHVQNVPQFSRTAPLSSSSVWAHESSGDTWPKHWVRWVFACLFKDLSSFYLCDACVPACKYVQLGSSAFSDQRENPQAVVSQTMWVPGLGVGSSAGAVHVFNTEPSLHPKGFLKTQFSCISSPFTPSYDRILDNIIVSVFLIPAKSLRVYFNIFET